MRKKDSESEKVEESVSIERPPLGRSNSIWLLRKPLVDEPAEEPAKAAVKAAVKAEPVKTVVKAEPGKAEPSRPARERSMTTSSFWPARMNTQDESKESPCPPPKQRLPKSPSPSRSGTLDGSDGKNFNLILQHYPRADETKHN